MWDIEVDVACVGAGIGTLAGAITTIDAGAEVLVATPSVGRPHVRSSVAVEQRVGGFLGSWTRAELDAQTGAYFAALTEDLDLTWAAPESRRLRVRAVREVADEDDVVEPFVGSKLRDWNAQCLTSAYGMLYSKVSGWQTKPMRASDGQALEVHVVGTMAAAELVDGNAITDWMLTQASERDLVLRPDSTLDRIVFEEGRITGVVLTTPDGPLRVGARHGVSIASLESQVPDIAPRSGGGDVQICLVGQAASRFMRVELLETVTPDLELRPNCAVSGRRMWSAMRESRLGSSSTWRCGEPR